MCLSTRCVPVCPLQDGRTPLHLSSEWGHLEVCSALVQAGSDTAARDAAGQTPVLLAARHNHAEVVKLLLKYSPELPDSADQVSRRPGNS